MKEGLLSAITPWAWDIPRCGVSGLAGLSGYEAAFVWAARMTTGVSISIPQIDGYYLAGRPGRPLSRPAKKTRAYF